MRDVCCNMPEGHFAVRRYPKSSSAHVNRTHERDIRELRIRVRMPEQVLYETDILCENSEIRLYFTLRRAHLPVTRFMSGEVCGTTLDIDLIIWRQALSSETSKDG